ncbi:13291_t:CDS:2, partial [Cetraspora pellucida]
MESDLDSTVEKNLNLKTGVTEEFSDLNIDKYNEICDVNENQNLQEVALFTKKLHTNRIIHSVLPIEYPATSKDDIATIFNISSWDNYIDAFNN